MKLEDICLPLSANLSQVMQNQRDTGLLATFIVSQNLEFLGILSAGDVRNAILAGADVTEACAKFANKNAVRADSKTELSELASLSHKYGLIPVVNDSGKLVNYYKNNVAESLSVSTPELLGGELRNVINCFETNWISSGGAYIQEFEEKFGEYVGAKRCLAVSNGTAAIELALAAYGIGAGDEVIVPALTFGATANAVLAVGATPVFVDVDIDSWNLDVACALKEINARTKAIIAVDLYGVPFDMKSLRDQLASTDFDVVLIQDCAESLGAFSAGKHTGSFADAYTFSFFANKIITSGEGGALCFTSSGAHISAAETIRSHGMDLNKRYWHIIPGHNYRMTNLQAGIAVAQLEQVDDFLKIRKTIFEQYESLIESLNPIYQVVDIGNIASPWLFTMMIEDVDIDELCQFLDKSLIPTRRVFVPLPATPAFEKYRCSDFTNACFIYDRSLSLPTYTQLGASQVAYISEKLIQATISLRVK